MLTENGRFSRLLEDLNRVNLTGYGYKTKSHSVIELICKVGQF